ncbi:selenide, water dikinase SelD [Allohahella marinimesophila]|uniref:Selenophosphate synthase n=1 Tax=Allohahella marinimesophila TaxID=1054972 RepID=A0ABP7PVD6_9GAMM
MMKSSEIVLRDIVLVGGGHSHAVVLKMLGMKPIPGVRITLICRDTHTPYSGMLPGYIAGHYSYDDTHIDLRRLAEFAGARFYRDEVIGIDRSRQTVQCRHRPELAYDVLSINTGSSPNVSAVVGAAQHAVPVKPINGFNDRWAQLLASITAGHSSSSPYQIAVVGAGAGGVELALALQHRLGSMRDSSAQPVAITVFGKEKSLLPQAPSALGKQFAEVLDTRGIRYVLGTAVSQVSERTLSTAGDGATYAADTTLWVTEAGGPAWLGGTGLDLDDKGFIRVTETLQSVNDPRIFATGDVATMIDHPRPKAGVFAVRQGKPLAINLRRYVENRSLFRYRPQRNWLALISTGDKYAFASKGRFLARGAWVWRWKDWIDRRFIARFSELPTMDEQPAAAQHNIALSSEENSQAISAVAMRCGGCGAKVGASVLSRAISSLKPVEREDVLVGLHAPDDAAVLSIPPGMALVHSIDFFRSFIDDPYIFGKVAANHSLGDIFAMGAEAQSATAVATIPQGLESKVEALLFQLMSGAVEVLNAAGCALVGGHTGEGQELALGFAINGLIDPATVLKKGGLLPGQKLILTKPIGTGTLFAAHARLAAKGRWIDAALESMVLSSQAAASCLRRHGATACTDVTGFGLLGHLVEMTKASGVDARLDLASIPVLEGALQTSKLGILSSLQPANVRLRRAISNQAESLDHPLYPLLFDPQTAGGLLAGVPANSVDQCVAELRRLGYAATVVIGDIQAMGDQLAPISLRY